MFSKFLDAFNKYFSFIASCFLFVTSCICVSPRIYDISDLLSVDDNLVTSIFLLGFIPFSLFSLLYNFIDFIRSIISEDEE